MTGSIPGDLGFPCSLELHASHRTRIGASAPEYRGAVRLCHGADPAGAQCHGASREWRGSGGDRVLFPCPVDDRRRALSKSDDSVGERWTPAFAGVTAPAQHPVILAQSLPSCKRGRESIPVVACTADFDGALGSAQMPFDRLATRPFIFGLIGSGRRVAAQTGLTVCNSRWPPPDSHAGAASRPA